MKKCSKCKEIKSFENFCKNKSSKDGHAYYCRPCFSLIKKINDPKYAKTQKGKKARAKAWKKYANKPEVRTRINELRKLRKKHDNRQKELRKVFDPQFYLVCTVRGRLNTFLKNLGLNKKCKMKDYLGCTPEYFKSYIESKFKENMNWKNRGEWHLDHIIPLSSAKTEDEIYKLCHYSNLQPLWAFDNLSKGNKVS